MARPRRRGTSAQRRPSGPASRSRGISQLWSRGPDSLRVEILSPPDGRPRSPLDPPARGFASSGASRPGDSVARGRAPRRSGRRDGRTAKRRGWDKRSLRLLAVRRHITARSGPRTRAAFAPTPDSARFRRFPSAQPDPITPRAHALPGRRLPRSEISAKSTARHSETVKSERNPPQRRSHDPGSRPPRLRPLPLPLPYPNPDFTPRIRSFFAVRNGFAGPI